MSKGWASLSRSHPVGKLALYWINAIAVDWRDAGDEWAGLSPTMRAALNAMLEGDDHRTAVAETMLASELRFLFEADPDWCQANIMPLFDWGLPDRATRAWDGFLTWGRFNDHLLDAGLLVRCIDTAANHTDRLRQATDQAFPEATGQLPAEAGERLFQHLAVVALVGGADQLLWISDFTAQVDAKELRAKWMRNVTQQMPQLPDGAAEIQWNRWMEPYWRQRINGPLRRLSAIEASAMASWVVELDRPESIASGVSLATSQPANLHGDTDLLENLRREQLVRAPGEYGRLVAHLLEHTESPLPGACYDLAGIVQQLRELSQPDAIDDIASHALRLGCQRASEW